MTVGTYALSKERSLQMSFTHGYLQHSLVFAFKENYALPLTRLLAPFQTSVWISILLLMAVAIFLILLTKQLSPRHRHFIIGGRVNRTPILNMINSLMGNVISNRQMTHWTYFGTFARTLTMLWLFFWLVVRNSYQGSLYEFLQSQRIESPFETVEKVKMSDAKINLSSAFSPFLPEGFSRDR